jgi:hypothetical protein
MAKYRLNQIAQSPNYDHEVHKEGCPWWPRENYIDLSDHPSCRGAVAEAKYYYRMPMAVRRVVQSVIGGRFAT